MPPRPAAPCARSPATTASTRRSSTRRSTCGPSPAATRMHDVGRRRPPAHRLRAPRGGRVYGGPEREVGVLPVTLTAEGAADPLFAGLPPSFPTLQWHGDTFDLPEGATLLASSPAFPNQAFRYGRAAYGIQFHMEVLPEMAREWALVPEYAGYADRVLGEGGMGWLLAEFDGAETGMRATGRAMFERWAELAVPVAG